VRGISIRRLLPASVLGIVLAFSYFAPALGFVGPPVREATHTNCGRFGYGYHGGKHDFVCPTHGPRPANGAPPPAPVRSFPPATGGNALPVTQPQVNRPASSQPASAPRTGSAAPTQKVVVDSNVTNGIGQWRAFVDLVVRELRAGS
jgi:hypothetical protein